MNGIDLILLGIIGFALFKRNRSNVYMPNKRTLEPTDFEVPEPPTTTMEQEPEPEPEIEPEPTPESKPTTTQPSRKDTELKLFEASWLKNARGLRPTNTTLFVKMGFYDYNVEDGIMYQNGLIKITNKKDFILTITQIEPRINLSQKTQTGKVIYYGDNKVPWTLYIAPNNDTVYNLTNPSDLGYYRQLRLPVHIGIGETFEVPFYVAIKVDDRIASVPFVASTNLVNAPVSLAMGLSLHSNSTDETFEWQETLKLADWNHKF